MNVRIYAMTHKKFKEPLDSMYVPLHVGRQGKDELGYQGDNTGDNISRLNPYYAELSGVYWVWKNVRDIDYVGICHYRRYLINDEEQLLTREEILDILESGEYDIIATKLLELRSNYYEGFKCNHNIKDMDATIEVIKRLYPEYYDELIKTLHSNRTYFGNIMICSKTLFDKYCEWLFDILFEVQKLVEIEDYDDYHKRLFGFISEMLLYVWCKVNRLKVYECKVGMVGEKRETVEMKNHLASYFKAHDFIGAHEYFAKCLAKRPDVLMEASDVFGELKLCMQIISTCEFEFDAHGSCVLDYKDDMIELLEFFKHVNGIVKRQLDGIDIDEDSRYIRENAVTKEMLDIAKMVMNV